MPVSAQKVKRSEVEIKLRCAVYSYSGGYIHFASWTVGRNRSMWWRTLQLSQMFL